MRAVFEVRHARRKSRGSNIIREKNFCRFKMQMHLRNLKLSVEEGEEGKRKMLCLSENDDRHEIFSSKRRAGLRMQCSMTGKRCETH